MSASTLEEIPASLLKLEQFRIKKICHFESIRTLQARINELRDEIRDFDRRLEHVRGDERQEANLRKKQSGYRSLLEVVEREFESLQERGRPDVQIYQKLERHLEREIAEWGVQ